MRHHTSTLLALGFLLSGGNLFAQRNRVHETVDNARRIRLAGHMHPRAVSQNDQGRMAASERLGSVTFVMRRSAEQQAALERLLAEQQDPSSPNFHRWLTSEEYADRFGVSPGDIAKVTAWAEQQGLHVTGVAKSRTWIRFSGTAGDAERAFRTEMHRYLVNGETHFANASDPSIPEALEPVVGGIEGLNDFRLKPRSRLQPRVNLNGRHYLSPGDLATIYNVKPLYDAGFTGSGQKIVVPGQTQINLADMRAFRERWGLPASDPDVVLVPNEPDPGVRNDDVGEANLDLQWAGAVAPDAKVIYVYSENVLDAVAYAIDENLAPVLSLSYGLCELETSPVQGRVLQLIAQQGNAQGITWLNASGDAGGADCIRGGSTNNGRAAVDIPAAIPEVTGVGGTEFNDAGGTFWSATNGPNGASALSYIPEVVWNDSTAGDPASGGGGESTFFAKPSWQTGLGVPADGARRVPDVSLTSSAQNTGYLVHVGGSWFSYGGTSAAAPALAGMIVLLNQYLVANGALQSPGLGNINPKLYTLSQTAPTAFHDIVEGHNMVDVVCTPTARNCVTGTYGFSAGTGYDMATGLGSVDAHALVTAWRTQFGSVRSATSLALVSSPETVTWTDTITLQATVTSQNGATPQGTVTFYLGTTPLGTAALTASSAQATASLTVNAPELSAGTNTVRAEYSGHPAFEGATATVVVTVTPPGSTAAPRISGVTNGASFRISSAPGALVSIFGEQLTPAGVSSAARIVPLPMQLAGVSATVNDVPAPLYYVSPGQLNVQIPYETPAGSDAVVKVNNNGQTATAVVSVSAAAPGIFTDAAGALVPTNRAPRGQIIEMYITGAGAVSPGVATGAAPAPTNNPFSLPKPVQSSSVTVGGVDAGIIFIGIPPALVGVTQINFQIPADAAPGEQPVVVTIGGVPSAPATLTVF